MWAVVDYLRRHDSGALETIFRLAAPAGGGATVVSAVHPNGLLLARRELETALGLPLDRALATGRAGMEAFARLRGHGSAFFATEPVEVPTAGAVAVHRLAERGQAWTAGERAALVAAVAAASEGALAARRDRRGAAAEAEADDARRRARRAYAAAVPYVPVSRCPFTNEALFLALDDGGLDGPWWDYQLPCEPVDPPGQPATFLSFDGAMALDADRLERTPHLCGPGPAAPQVVAPLLGRAGVRAVVSSLPVGPHRGVVVAYFADPAAPAPAPPWVDRWGAGAYFRREDGVAVGVDQAPPAGYDADLRRWIAAGRLSWIAPGDSALTLSADPTAPCPYAPADPAAIGPARQWTKLGRLWVA